MHDHAPIALLEVENLSLAHLWRALSFKVYASEILQIRGVNGAGKTSLIKVLCGLLKADKGRVSWQHCNIEQYADDYRQQIAYVGHKDGIKADLTPQENLTFAHTLSNANGMSVSDALSQWQLTHLSKPCRMLSAGQRRRTALARLLVVNASLWFLDEPLTALDSCGQDILGKAVSAHLGSGGSVVMATHQVPDWSFTTQVLTLDPL